MRHTRGPSRCRTVGFREQVRGATQGPAGADPKGGGQLELSDTVRGVLVEDRVQHLAGRCAELCGTYHSQMNFEVRVVAQQTFANYLAALKKIGPTDPDRQAKALKIAMPGHSPCPVRAPTRTGPPPDPKATTPTHPANGIIDRGPSL